jgi:hypothetical protein
MTRMPKPPPESQSAEPPASAPAGAQPPAAAPPPAPEPLPRVIRAYGIKGLRAYALKLLQQQLHDLQDRKLSAADREFLLASIRALGAAGKTAQAADKGEDAQGSQGGRDPLKLLRG